MRTGAARGYVHDCGCGPTDPLAGLVPVSRDMLQSGWGLWLIHQFDIDTTLIHSDDGFTVRLRAEWGEPGPLTIP